MDRLKLETIANHWLARFETALAQRDVALLKSLFHPDSHWRDVLAFTSRIATVSGRDALSEQLIAHAGRAEATAFRTDPERTAPRHATRAGTQCVEAIFRFDTAEGRGSGVLRFLADDGEAPKAWTFPTTRASRGRDCPRSRSASTCGC